jgi:hypothetical protein
VPPRQTRPLDSARWIFGDSLGDPTGDEIWTLAKDPPNGVTRTDVRDLFSRFVARHKTAVLFPDPLCARKRRHRAVRPRPH